MNSTHKTVDDYLASVPAEARATLEHLRQLIRKLAPEAEETISYQMPAFKLHGKPLVYYAAFKNHLSFFPANSTLMESMKEELKEFKVLKGTLHFTSEKPLPDELVKRLVQARIRENDATEQKRKKKRAAKGK